MVKEVTLTSSQSAKFTPPSQDVVDKFGYTYDESAYGDGPIHLTYPPFQWDGLSTDIPPST